MDLSLGFLLYSIDIYFCLCASTILSWWLWLCSRAWSQAAWLIQFHSSFSRLLLLFEVFFFFFFLYFHTNCEIICPSSLKNTIGSVHWVYRLLWVVYSFSLYWFFWSMNKVYAGRFFTIWAVILKRKGLETQNLDAPKWWVSVIWCPGWGLRQKRPLVKTKEIPIKHGF